MSSQNMACPRLLWLTIGAKSVCYAQEGLAPPVCTPAAHHPPVQNIFGIRRKVFFLVRNSQKPSTKESKVQKVGDLSLSSRDVSIIGRACQASLLIVRLELYGIHDISSSVLTLPFSSSNKLVSSLVLKCFQNGIFGRELTLVAI